MQPALLLLFGIPSPANPRPWALLPKSPCMSPRSWSPDLVGSRWEAANHEFKLAGLDIDVETGDFTGDPTTKLYKLYTEVIGEIQHHFQQIGKGSRKVLTETSLIRTTKDAAMNAATIYLQGGVSTSAGKDRSSFETKMMPLHLSRYTTVKWAAMHQRRSTEDCNRLDMVDPSGEVHDIASCVEDSGFLRSQR
ncbi:hypothetical protein FDECE_9439 [Fusarium decemcellulare]|nr:hypothetical protein FDECE_9439 [Fusarium decemcellulare]